MTFYSINIEHLLDPVREWHGVKAIDRYGTYYDINCDGDWVKLYLPYKRAFSWEYYDSTEEAENARRTAILAKYGNIKRERARLYKEMRKLREVIKSWEEETRK